MLNFTRKKNLTLPMLRPVIDKEFYVKVQSAITLSKVPPKQGENPAHVMEVIDLETGEEKIMIANAVIVRAFEEDYEGEAYVGKCFAMTKHAIKGSSKFNPYSITEIELVEDSE